jgi:hypothetical protein
VSFGGGLTGIAVHHRHNAHGFIYVLEGQYEGGKKLMKDVADTFVEDTTGEGSMGKYTGGHSYPTHDEIARLAYNLYES